MGIRPHHAELPIRQVDSESHHPKHKSGMWQKIHSLFIRDDLNESPVDGTNEEQWPANWNEDSQDHARQDSSVRPLAIGLPRQATFRRQNSERRERLLLVEPCHAERRAVSSVRRASTSLPRPRAISSPPHCDPGRSSAPNVATTIKADTAPSEVQIDPTPSSLEPDLPVDSEDLWPQDIHRPPRPPSTTSSDDSHFPRMPPVDDKADLRDELDNRWILNLSMHFRDKSDREKFFVTYAETPTKWRRVTISCDYRNAEPCSLEMDLKELQFQRDKSMQIYESIRDSLPEIQFYETVTNLKLETTDGRLHVHVTEDVNEIIPYPPRNTVAHILDNKDFRPKEVQENELAFDSHLSGFVYKVRHKNKVYIKKEIPGPDTVDEFLYEINALHALHGSSHVIQLEALVLDDTRQSVRGLLISFAEKGAVVDLLYDHRGSIPWEDRSRWAEQAVRGLSEIHEEGFVQGDFTLSNIVVDQEGNAKIIDINRRGCPVGWEPPEIATKIASNQRISMYIGEKSDLYQLGMTMWALAMDDDEPERHVPPLSVEEFPSEVPEWYQDIVRICLADRPRDRLSAKALIQLFPQEASRSRQPSLQRERPALKLRTPKDYIDPADAVGRDDIERFSQYGVGDIPYSPESSRDDYTFTYPKSSNYEFDSETSAYDRPRGRAPPSNYSHLGRSERHHWQPNDEQPASTVEAEPNIVAISPGMDREFDEVELDGHPYLVSRKTFNDEEMQILEGLADSDQPPPTDSALDIVTPQSMQTTIDSRRRPSLHTANSLTSDSTPRNSQSELPTLAHLPSTAEGSEVEAFGARKPVDLDREETNVQITRGTLSTLQSKPHLDESKGLQSRPQKDTVLNSREPPRLPYADSGFDEPLDTPSEDHLEHNHLATVEPEAETCPTGQVSAPLPAMKSHQVSTHDDEAVCKPQLQEVTSGSPLTHPAHVPSHQQSRSALPLADSGLGDDVSSNSQRCEPTAP